MCKAQWFVRVFCGNMVAPLLSLTAKLAALVCFLEGAASTWKRCSRHGGNSLSNGQGAII